MKGNSPNMADTYHTVGSLLRAPPPGQQSQSENLANKVSLVNMLQWQNTLNILIKYLWQSKKIYKSSYYLTFVGNRNKSFIGAFLKIAEKFL
jgi:hypothetical protein